VHRPEKILATPTRSTVLHAVLTMMIMMMMVMIPYSY